MGSDNARSGPPAGIASRAGVLANWVKALGWAIAVVPPMFATVLVAASGQPAFPTQPLCFVIAFGRIRPGRRCPLHCPVSR